MKFINLDYSAAVKVHNNNNIIAVACLLSLPFNLIPSLQYCYLLSTINAKNKKYDRRPSPIGP